MSNLETKENLDKQNVEKNKLTANNDVSKTVDLSKIPDSVSFQKMRVPKSLKGIAIFVVFCFIIIGICIGIIVSSVIIKFTKV